MRVFRYSPLLIILIVLFTGCKTTQPGKTVEQPVEIVPVVLEELRGCAVLPESWIGADAAATEEKINSVMAEIAQANFNAVFLSVGDAGENSENWKNTGSDPLKIAVEAAHNRNLRIFFRFDPVEGALRNKVVDLPPMKTYLKSVAGNLIREYNLDGICLDLTDFSFQPFPAGALALAKYRADTLQFVRMPEVTANAFLVDLIEDIMVEIMVVKPYLVNSIIYKGDIAKLTASGCLEEGITDLIFNLSQMEVFSSDSNLSGYPERIEIPRNLKRVNPRQVVRLDLSELFSPDTEGQPVFFDMMKKFKMADTRGQIGFITPPVDTIRFRTPSGEVTLPTGYWSIPYSYSVLADNSVVRKAPWLEFRRMPGDYTNAADFDLLSKTDYPSFVTINGEPVKQYKTGIFFRKVSFLEGFNRVRAEVVTPDSITAFYEMEYFYEKVDRTRKSFPLWIDSRTVAPSTGNEMLPGDVVRVSFQGSLGQEGYVILSPGGLTLKCTRVNYGDYSLYLADVPLSGLETGTGYNIKLRLEPQPGVPDEMPLEYDMQNSITVRPLADFPLVRVRRENSRLIYNLGAPRLGGPIRSELGPGVVMKTNGKIGENYRVRLSRAEEGFIHQSEVEVLGKETVQPSYYVTSMSCVPSSGADILSIPYLEPVPYEVYPDPDQKRIVVSLFGAESSSTWITHRRGRKIIDKITWQQTTPETFQVYINLNTSAIWGYDVKVEGSRLVVRVKYPPVYDLESAKPLTGLKIAIEAGHGGSNTGAVGLSGLLEKDINLDLSLRLAKMMKEMGAEIVQVRETDIDMTLIEKRDIAVQSGAHMLISIHANAGGTGYLQVAGTSTYWHNPFWAPLAEHIYDRLLELDLAEFGVVGSFNYTVTRVSQMPSVLVEQAFMSHAEDEEKMADQDFRQQMAEKICAGIIDYLKYVRGKK